LKQKEKIKPKYYVPLEWDTNIIDQTMKEE